MYIPKVVEIGPTIAHRTARRMNPRSAESMYLSRLRAAPAFWKKRESDNPSGDPLSISSVGITRLVATAAAPPARSGVSTVRDQSAAYRGNSWVRRD